MAKTILPARKICTKCKTEKPLTEFFRSKHRPGGYDYCCKACHMSYYKKREKPPKEVLPPGTKRCRVCKQVLPIERFCKYNKRYYHEDKWYPDRPVSECKPCMSKRACRTIKEKKRRCVAYLGGACADCGLVDPIIDVYDFHHRDPAQKDLHLGNKMSYAFETLRPELDKCDLLCANCHRRRHAALHLKSPS